MPGVELAIVKIPEKISPTTRNEDLKFLHIHSILKNYITAPESKIGIIGLKMIWSLADNVELTEKIEVSSEDSKCIWDRNCPD
jgi:hypothetical protein